MKSSCRPPLKQLPSRCAIAIFLLTAVFMSGFARAEGIKAEDDIVALSLTVEDWIKTEGATAYVEIDAALDGEEVAAIRSQMLQGLARLAAGEWRITRFSNSRDRSGLQRWSASAQARLGEDALDGLRNRAASLSRPGLRFRINRLEFNPTLVEREAARALLRKRLYERIGQEIVMLEAAFPGRRFRLKRLETDPPMGARPAMLNARAEAAPMITAKQAPMTVSQKIRLSARVILAAQP